MFLEVAAISWYSKCAPHPHSSTIAKESNHLVNSIVSPFRTRWSNLKLQFSCICYSRRHHREELHVVIKHPMKYETRQKSRKTGRDARVELHDTPRNTSTYGEGRPQSLSVWPPTSSTWDGVRNAESQALPQNYWIRVSILTRLPCDLCACWRFRHRFVLLFIFPSLGSPGRKLFSPGVGISYFLLSPTCCLHYRHHQAFTLRAA